MSVINITSRVNLPSLTAVTSRGSIVSRPGKPGGPFWESFSSTVCGAERTNRLVMGQLITGVCHYYFYNYRCRSCCVNIVLTDFTCIAKLGIMCRWLFHYWLGLVKHFAILPQHYYIEIKQQFFSSSLSCNGQHYTRNGFNKLKKKNATSLV